jgi:hypothetical protein
MKEKKAQGIGREVSLSHLEKDLNNTIHKKLKE